jgi:elongation factor G
VNQYPPDKIRNVALVGHSGAGKTSVVEALLYRAGVIGRMGEITEGSTVTDFDPEEQRRGFSLSLALAPIEWKGHKINLIDTPGYADFIGDVMAALRVADMALFVVSAVEGVEVQHEAIWRICEDMGLPRMIFINKLNKEHASFERTLVQLRERFGSGVAPIELPVGEEADFHGIADLFTETAWFYESGKAVKAAIPAEMAAREQEVHDQLVEEIVEADDELLEKYLEGEVPSADRLEATMAKAVAEARVFPVLEGSALGPIAIDRLADYICELGPSPADRPPITVHAGDREVEVHAQPSGDPLVFVFKTIADPYVGQITLFRVFSGTVEPDHRLVNTTTGTEERLHGLFTLRGKEQVPMERIPAGDLGAVAKLSATGTGHTLAPKSLPVRIHDIERPAPVLSIAIKPKSQADEDKLANAIPRLLEEDPALVMERNDETRQTLLKGMGETHLAIALEKLSRKFGVEIETEEPRVPYRETISTIAQAEGKYKKQTGGHGQYGVATVRLEPLERGTGFEFVDEIKGGAIPRQFIPAVEKGIAEALVEGGVYGFPIVDVRAVCTDGKYHSVDSSEMSFKMAGRLALREALPAARPVMLEPISRIEVTVPSGFQGDIMGDLSSRRGQLQGSHAGAKGEQTIVALVPTSEVMRYAIDLRSITHGSGRFTIEHDHYDVVPPNLVDRILAAVKAAAED